MSLTHETVFVIYEKPRDYPDSFVVRSYEIGHDPGDLLFFRPKPAQLTDSLEHARELIPRGLACIGRDSLDEPQIVETWL